jgi:hypothetical protein
MAAKNDEPYTRRELIGPPDFPPARGEHCPHCDMRIPQFADIADADLARVRQLMREERTMAAIQELVAATNAPLAFAHLWVSHRGRPMPPDGFDPTPCPHCGKPVRTALAKQCRHCKRDWHDPDAVRRLGE